MSVIPLIEHSDLMLATLHPAPFSGENWIFELKYDGFRCLVRKVGSRVELLSRNGKPLNRSFPDVVAAIERLPVASCASVLNPQTIGATKASNS